MTKIEIPLGRKLVQAFLPTGAEILRMTEPEPLVDPESALLEALARPIGTKPLAEIAQERARSAEGEGHPARACVVVSDNTRPVPYKGRGGILLHVLRVLLDSGFAPRNICVLVATGTHRSMARDELEAVFGVEPFYLGVEIVNHDCHDKAGLVDIGTTARGTHASINRRYVEADLKILTGLVESHFMAGASGGPKAICPGISGEEVTYVFHGATLMAHLNSRDLSIEGNPVHEESLAVAKMAGADFIVNVTLDGSFRITGIFCGELEATHATAVAKLKSYVGIPVEKPYDLVVTHGGFVAVNHYQAAKAAVASLGAVAPGGGLIMVADNRDVKPIGADRYRIVLSLLKLVGAETLDRILASPDWTFVPEQWQVQMWAKVFKRIAMRDFIYFAPQLNDRDWRDLPGTDGRRYISTDSRIAPCIEDVAAVIEGAVSDFLARRGFSIEDVATGRCRIAFLADGPYGIPFSAGAWA